MGLTPEQWENVKALFETALEKAPAERVAFLAAASRDPAVEQEVKRLLASHDEVSDFMSSAPMPVSPNPAAPQGSSLRSGDLLAERFRVIRFLARGGMGEIYEAEDTELRERVAIKTIRPELLRDSRTLERFRREVHLAKKVTHPNVCRVFDLFRHKGPPAAGDRAGEGLVFVAMELLEGETLADRLRRETRLKLDDAEPVALQIAAGLGAAHEAGVLHRDLKPGNVILVSSAKGVRAVVTDFGLALRAESDSRSHGSVTGTGESLGTPAYMSPEQVEGRELTPASDVYALGLVLYQMVTGVRPFEDPTPLTMAVRRLREDPAPPRTLVPELDAHWEQVILRCLAREPAVRFQNADEVAAALRGKIGVRPAAPASRSVPTVAFAALVVIVVAALLVAAVTRRRANLRRQSAGATAAHVQLRRSVAVLPLRNLSGRPETNWVSTALADMLTAELAAGEKLRIVPGENIARASADLSLSGKETLAKDTLARLRQYLGSDFVVLGSYLDLGGAGESQIRVDLRLQDASSGDIFATISEKGSERELDDLVTRAGADLREKLGAGGVPAAEAALAKTALPSSPEAVQLYSEGAAKLRVFDALAARGLLEKGVASDPRSALMHSALADAWSALGYDEKAKAESEKAFQLASGLPREQRLWIEARNWAAHKDWDKAAQVYRSLLDFFPDNIDYGLSLAGTLIKAGKSNDALEVLAGLEKLPEPASDDPRIEIERAAAHDALGNFQDEQNMADRAAAKARSQGARLLLARALDAKTRSFGNRGMWKESSATAGEAKQIYAEAGDQAGVARSLRSLGVVAYKQGNYGGAVDSYRDALRIEHNIGNDAAAATTLTDIAVVVWDQGDWQESERASKESIQLFQKVDDKAGYSTALDNYAGILLDRGDLGGARKMYLEVLRVSQQIGDKSTEAVALVNLADALAKQGALTEAKQTYERAFNIFGTIGDQSGSAYPLMGQGDLLVTEGNLSGAREKYNQALTLRQQVGEQATAAATRLALARVSLEEGGREEVEAAVRTLLADFRGKNDVEGQIDAGVLLTVVLLEEHRTDDAHGALVQTEEAAKPNQNLEKSLWIAITASRVDGASGELDPALQRLRTTVARAEKSGYVGLKLEAQLALGTIQIAAGSSAAGQATLAAVKREAQSRGYGLIASKAAKVKAGKG